MKDIKMAALESGSAWGLAAISNFGWIKFASLGAALIGAGMMAIFRPPQSRKEMFQQGAVALGCSLLFGDTAVAWAVSAFPSIPLTSPAIYGLIGAMSWGAFGGLAHLRDKVAKDPVETIKDVKSI